MSFINWHWGDDDNDEYRSYIRATELAQEDAQRDAEKHLMAQHQAAAAQAGNLLGTMDDSGNFYGTASTYIYQPPPPSPTEQGEHLLDSLNYLDPIFVKEIVIVETVYMQILEILGLNPKDQEDLIQQLTYQHAYGTILLKNEKYLFNLDKYLEDGPSEEI